MNRNQTENSRDDTRPSVINGAARQDQRAWERFFGIYGPIVYRYARHAGLREHDADEVVSCVMRNMVVAFQNGFAYDPSVGRFRHYLRRVANRVISAVRANQPLGQHYDPEELLAAPDPGDADREHWRAMEAQERLRACWDRLMTTGEISVRDREAFESFALRDEPAPTVAARLAISENRLYGIKHEIIKKLRAVDRGLTRILGEV